MERREIEEKVRQILIEDIEVDEENIFPEARLKEDLGIDSLDYVDILVRINHNSGLKIKQAELKGVNTFAKFCDYIESKVN